jgi:chemotaxis protein MotA
MIALIGLVVVIASVIGGFTIAGGKLIALFQISEIVVILGTAVGTVLIATPPAVLKALGEKLPKIVQPSPFGKALYLDVLKMMYEIFQTARRDGLMAIEAHIEAPEKSSLFARYSLVLRHHHVIVYLCDSLRLVLVGSVPPHDLETLMDGEIDVHHEQEAMPVSTMARVGDALPGIGIVAAVLGIVVTMGAISGPVEKIGEKVAAALVGTFLGVLCAYGFVNPISAGLEHINTVESRIYYVTKACVVAFAKGLSPIVAVEFGRRAIFAESRPTFAEMEAACKSLKAQNRAAGAAK